MKPGSLIPDVLIDGWKLNLPTKGDDTVSNKDLKKVAEYHTDIVRRLIKGGLSYNEAKDKSWGELEKTPYWNGGLKGDMSYNGILGNILREIKPPQSEQKEQKAAPDNYDNQDKKRTFGERMGASDFILYWFEEEGNDFLPATFETLGPAAGYTPAAYFHGIIKLREKGYTMATEGGDGTSNRSFWRVTDRPQNRAKKLADIAGKLPKDDQNALLSIIEDLLSENK